MAIEIKQNLKLTQQLVMTPQLQQAIKLLQLSRMELLDLIRQEVKENPILDESVDGSAENNDQETQIAEEIGLTKEEGASSDSGRDREFEWQDYLYQEARTPWEPSTSRESEEDESGQLIERSPGRKGGLKEYLFEQLLLSPLDEADREMGELIIGSIDNNGYLTLSMEELGVLSGLSEQRIAPVLEEIQGFDPPGVAARDLKECLMLQLKETKGETKALVERILSDHLTDLATKKYYAIAKDLNASRQEVIEAVKIINSLEPKPGRAFSTEDPQYITPDLYVYKVEGEYVVILNDDGMPRLHINPFYRQVLANNHGFPDESKEYIQTKLRSAVWFIKSIYHRQNTLRNVMYSIIKFQREFFDKGIAYLRPLVLREVAEDIAMHESTVSRATNSKYVHTSHGIFELKFFFNSSINSVDGDNVASESVKDMIRKIVARENPQAPFSDQAIVKILKTKNINIARRTVTKYREMMSILPSSKRRKVF